MTKFFFSELNKLKNAQIHLEKKINLPKLIGNNGEELELLDYIIDKEKNHDSEKEHLYSEIKNIWSLLQEQKCCLKSQNLNDLDVRQFKQNMINIQGKIEKLKTEIKLKENVVKNEGTKLAEIIEIIDQKLMDWDVPFNMPNYVIPKHSKLIENSDNNKEVQEFLDFVQESNGHENGWNSKDHQLFLRLKRKIKNINELAMHLNKLLPDISEEEIKLHHEWHAKYISLKKRKDEALREWRKTRNMKPEIETPAIIPQAQTEIKKNPKSNRSEIQEKLIQWKNEKLAKSEQQTIIEQIQKKNKKQQIEQKRKLQLEAKESVINWKQEKITQKRNVELLKSLESENQRKIKAAIANRMIRQFQSQDDLIVAKIRAQRVKKENQSQKRIKSSCVVDRDPERILKSTKQWIMRTKPDEQMKNQSIFIPNIKVIPKLKIPEWRKAS